MTPEQVAQYRAIWEGLRDSDAGRTLINEIVDHVEASKYSPQMLDNMFGADRHER